MSNGCELLSSAEMAMADRLAVSLGVESLTLMERAGQIVADVAAEIAGPPGGHIAILCGPGNNGGDGFVAGRLLSQRGYRVRLALVGDRGAMAGDAAVMAERYQGAIETASNAAEVCGWAHVIIDALFGAGLNRPLAGAAAAVVEAINGSGKPVLAVDVPSGLDGSTGTAGGAVVRATRTVTFFRLKPGHLLLPGRTLCGEITLGDIGIPSAVLDAIAPRVWRNSLALWGREFPRIRGEGHKYNRGHAVVVSGGVEMSGAARLCARGALRMGAGLVTVASPPDALLAHASQLNAILLKAGQQPQELRHLLTDRRYNAVAIGPGLGLGEVSLDRVTTVLSMGAATVLDADAITVAAGAAADLFGAIGTLGDRPVVMTPHEGEFKRLFPSLEGCKLQRAIAAAKLSGGVILLKGPDTVIASPDGRAAINDNAPPWLATAGSGDVLTGFVTGLLAQAMPAFEATCAAVWLHGACAKAFGPGLIAEDIPEVLPRVLGGVLDEIRSR
jgi:ADP-dependent NAD(P)H-hydrate dehydratase / NAD(P)H-hydrate epimerase